MVKQWGIIYHFNLIFVFGVIFVEFGILLWANPLEAQQILVDSDHKHAKLNTANQWLLTWGDRELKVWDLDTGEAFLTSSSLST